MSRLVVVCLLVAAAGNADSLRVLFEGPLAEYKWALKEVNPELPSDWSPFEFLVLELKASSPQRFELRLHTAAGTRSQRLHPFSGVWIRAAVPLRYFRRPDREGFDMASMGNKPRSTFWINLSGAVGSLESVEALGVAMQNPIGRPTLEIRSVRLAKEDPGDAVLDPGPVVDEFGQWKPAEWPGKANSLEQLRKAWSAEETELGAGDFDYCRYGGYRSSQAKATGFFRVGQIQGRWWFVDPDGHLFFSVGSNVIGAFSGTRTEGREAVFAALPPPDLSPAMRAGARAGQASFYTWNLLRRFGSDWPQKWLELTFRRMEAWGFNTIGNWSDPRLGEAHRKAYVVTLRGWGIESAPMGMPDVYSSEWARQVEEAAAQQCAPRKDDPWLLGYFVANEPPWPGREQLLAEMILEGRDSAIQRELKAFLKGEDTPERRRAFIWQSFEKMLATINAAIRKHDPNHLNLGIRFGGRPSDEVIRAARVFDVYSQNVYDYAPDPAALDRIYKLAGRPIVIGEFHFGTPGRGLAPGLRQTANQYERGVAYRYYVENAAAHPALIGTHWFQWLDQPATGRMDGENYNIGFLDVTDRPYPELVEAAKLTHRRLFAVHSGKQPPVSQKAEIR